jgi:hypothetical protein
MTEAQPLAPTNATQGRHIPIEPWEIGGELLDIVSRGLYSNAKDALREYVQNSVDAKAKEVTITVDGDRVTIRDNGSGMDERVLRAARRVGWSEKSPQNMVGYRGIGIYSSFGMCETMTIRTRKKGMEHVLGWRFYFGEIRRLLEADKSSKQRRGLSLPDLLFQYSSWLDDEYEGKRQDAGFTSVVLELLGEEFRAQLNDAGDVTTYLLNTIPIAYPRDRSGSSINDWLRLNVRLNPVGVQLRIGSEPPFPVNPSIPKDVGEPECDWISSTEGVRLAFVWYALSTTGRQVADSSVSGFALKQRGFTLGSHDVLKPNWPAVGGRTLYHHYVGEIHILPAAAVFPNAARDDLEASPQRQIFLKRVSDFFDTLNRRANVQRAITRADRLTGDLRQTMTRLQARLADPNASPFEIYAEARTLREEVETVQREIDKETKPGRRRPAVKLTPDQGDALKKTTVSITNALASLDSVISQAQVRTEQPETKGGRPKTRQTPQVALLANAAQLARSMIQESSDPTAASLLDQLDAAAKTHVVPRAVAALDELKARGFTVSAELEETRRELRTLLGWSPVAPVSLVEALLQVGVSAESQREDAIFAAVDRGLLAALGGRGDRYEAALRSIADVLASDASQ